MIRKIYLLLYVSLLFISCSTVENIAYFQRVDAMNLKNPRLIGFGISNKVTFDAACDNASGAIIGSKFVTLLESEGTIDEAVEQLIEAISK